MIYNRIWEKREMWLQKRDREREREIDRDRRMIAELHKRIAPTEI